MDSNTAIGNVTQIVVKTTNKWGQDVENKLNKNFMVNSSATYANVDTAARALVTMSSDTYSDTICITNISVNEVLAG